MYDAVVFAGGGNRCYWQGGFYETVAPRLGLAPKLVVGASAGAFAATYCLLGAGPAVRENVYAGAGPHLKNFDFSGWRRGEALCPVGPLYLALLRQTIDTAALARINAATDLQIAVTRLPRGLWPMPGAMIGIGAYQLEKHLLHPVHPRLGRALGYRPEFISSRALADAGEMHDVLMASSGVPPFMPVTSVKGSPAFDGGLVDNVPVAPIRPIEAAGGRTLVLLTRVYRNIPNVSGRTYTQPSRRMELSQFDITDPDAIRAAYELGVKDGEAFVKAHDG